MAIDHLSVLVCRVQGNLETIIRIAYVWLVFAVKHIVALGLGLGSRVRVRLEMRIMIHAKGYHFETHTYKDRHLCNCMQSRAHIFLSDLCYLSNFFFLLVYRKSRPCAGFYFKR